MTRGQRDRTIAIALLRCPIRESATWWISPVFSQVPAQIARLRASAGWIDNSDVTPYYGHQLFPKSSGSSRAFLGGPVDRKSTRLNSSHLGISYAVFCLHKKT